MAQKRAIAHIVKDIEAHSPEFARFAQQFLSSLNQEHVIPLSAFKSSRTVLQNVVMYLRDHKSLSNKAIGKLLNRSTKTIWVAHGAAKKKSAGPQVISFDVVIPLSIFATKRTLQALVVYCRDVLHMDNAAIARALKRDTKTISSVYAHAKRGDAS